MSTSRIGVCSWSLQPESPDDLIGRLQRLGIDTVQLALSPLIHEPEIWSESVDLLRAAGVEIVSGMMTMADENYATLETIASTGGVRPNETWDANRVHAEAVAHAAQAGQIGLVTFHAGFLPEDPDDPERTVILDRLRSLADIFLTRGIEIGLETGQESAETLLAVLELLDRVNVGVNFDPANMILYGTGEPVAALESLAPHVVQIHIKDAMPTDTPGTWGREVPAGAGDVDWPAFFETAAEISPPVDFIIEREGGEDREPDIAAAKELIKRFLPR
jgi:L-ribulose-5-phosphate 3-epimerase